ncbi:Uncharacterised protein [Vibrio cholerae]|nr:Uncharacterised protein [Vibrio cholerae]
MIFGQKRAVAVDDIDERLMLLINLLQSCFEVLIPFE